VVSATDPHGRNLGFLDPKSESINSSGTKKQREAECEGKQWRERKGCKSNVTSSKEVRIEI
jgi:hypothetical protein